MLSFDRAEPRTSEELDSSDRPSEGARALEGGETQAQILEKLSAARLQRGRRKSLDDAFSPDSSEQENTTPASVESVERSSTEVLAQHLSTAWHELQEKREQLAGKKEFAKTSFVAGGLAIEGQEISCTDYPNELKLSFKLADHHYQTIIQEVKAQGKADKLALRSAIHEKKQISLKNAYAIQDRGMTMRVAAPMSKMGEALRGAISVPIDKVSEELIGMFFAQPYVGARGHAADRLVTISIPKPQSGQSPDFDSIATNVQALLKERLDIEGGLNTPTSREEGLLKQFAFAEHHRLGAEEVTSAQTEKLERKEVFPGHTAYVEEGRHHEYQKISPYAIYHRIAFGSTVGKARDTIVKILGGDGLMATTERLSRGVIFEGKSSSSDIDTGGGDSVFTRVITRDGVKGEKMTGGGGYLLILDPALLDRTDWYAYTSDKYGSKDPEWYNNRLSPNGFMNVLKERHRRSNEVMFPAGVPKEQVVGIQCDSEKDRLNLLNDLHTAGVQEVHGIPVEDLLFVGTLNDSIRRSQKEMPVPVRALKKKKGALGTNAGGIYEDPKTNEQLYVKLYNNPEQAKTEYLANAIYEKAGIRTANSQLFEMDGRLAIGSPLIEGLAPMKPQEMSASAEIKRGFIVDAFLGNWDVIGLKADNILKTENGEPVRIDSGGSLNFRARGLKKAFAEEVPEIDTMRDAKFPSGQVFSGLSEGDLRGQAERFVQTVSEEDIKNCIASAHLSTDDQQEMEHILTARRRALIQRFQITLERSTV